MSVKSKSKIKTDVTMDEMNVHKERIEKILSEMYQETFDDGKLPFYIISFIENSMYVGDFWIEISLDVGDIAEETLSMLPLKRHVRKGIIFEFMGLECDKSNNIIGINVLMNYKDEYEYYINFYTSD